jgi:catechol 2,3-dioxygenase-like lactoylglutathione lyase family enzyme
VTGTIDLDHTSFAVDDALAWARRLRRDLGAVPVAGEVLPEFRYLLLYVGTATSGARIELLEPAGDGFLSRFLARHGPGPHHLTFTVPDLRAAVAAARGLGATVVGEDYRHASWREAFLVPDDRHGVVVQLAQTDFVYPTPAELLATDERDPLAFPSSAGAVEPHWWAPVWDTEPAGATILGATHLVSTDLAHTRDLFGGLLDAGVTEVEDGLLLTWPSGAVRVHRGDRPGVLGMDLAGAHPVHIGDAVLGAP